MTVSDALVEAEPDTVAPLANPVAVPARVAEPPVALVGTTICACNWIFVVNAPRVQVEVPPPLPQKLNVAPAKLVGCADTCTVTFLADPPTGQTSIVYCAVCPGCTAVVVASTLMQSCVIVADPVEVELGEPVGKGPGGGVVGAGGSNWQTPLVPVVVPV